MCIYTLKKQKFKKNPQEGVVRDSIERPKLYAYTA